MRVMNMSKQTQTNCKLKEEPHMTTHEGDEGQVQISCNRDSKENITHEEGTYKIKQEKLNY